jgi:hypothetical protein
MDWSVNEGETRIESSKALNGFGSAVDRAVVHDPEDSTGIVVMWAGHPLLDEPVKRCNAIL